MGVTSQLELDWAAPSNPAPPATIRGTAYHDLVELVKRVRQAGLTRLRQLKALVDAAIREEELVITDEDLPF